MPLSERGEQGGVIDTDIIPTITSSAFQDNNFVVMTDKKIMQKVGDRAKPSVSVKDTAFTVAANPMSDRGQYVVEIRACALRGRADGGWTEAAHSQRLEIGTDISNSLTTVQKDNMVSINKNDKTMKQEKRLELPEELRGKGFRIRKLTPRECFRLMDVSEDDIDKIQAAGISKSQLYKLAGNSIVVNCMTLIRKPVLPAENRRRATVAVLNEAKSQRKLCFSVKRITLQMNSVMESLLSRISDKLQKAANPQANNQGEKVVKHIFIIIIQNR
ncbi:MAG: DNA cytosine methyltransferase [Muribaculaceae bacterium]|nr:DNA cytosine methyltransferase [Muribaculaceae bacterium]